MPGITLNRRKDGSLVLKMDDKLIHFRTQDSFNEFASTVVTSWNDNGGTRQLIRLGDISLFLKPEDCLMLMALIASHVLKSDDIDRGQTPETPVVSDPYTLLLRNAWAEFA